MLNDFLQQLRQQIVSAIEPYVRRIRNELDPHVMRLRARYQKLERRERILVQLAGSLLAVFLGYSLIVSPIIEYVDGLDARITARERDLAGARRLVATYAMVRADLNTARHNTVPSKDFSLFSVVEKVFTTSVGHDKIASITPEADRKLPDKLVQYSVLIKLNDVNLAQVVDALYAVRTLSVPVGIANLRIERRTQNTHSFDVDLTCVALGRNA
jgi:hypothetical protein